MGHQGYSRGWLTFFVVQVVVASCLVFHDFGSGWVLADAALLALWTWLGLREFERLITPITVTVQIPEGTEIEWKEAA